MYKDCKRCPSPLFPHISLFLPWQQSPISLGRSIPPPPCTHHYDNHSQFTPTQEVLSTPGIFPSEITMTVVKLLNYTSTSGHWIPIIRFESPLTNMPMLNPPHPGPRSLISATSRSIEASFLSTSTPIFQKGSGALDHLSPYKGHPWLAMLEASLPIDVINPPDIRLQ